MTAEDTDNRDKDQREDEQRDEGNSDESNSEESNSDEGDRDDDRDDEQREDDDKVKQDDRYSDKTPGVADARPGRDDIGEGQMPSDYHEAVAQRPVEVKLPETPDLSEDAERNDD